MKNGKKVAAMALFALGWGLAKSYAVAKEESQYSLAHDPLAPILLEARGLDAVSPWRLAETVVIGPAIEEYGFRKVLQPRVGKTTASVLFGLSHADPRAGSYARVAAKTIDAAAGGLLYGTAFAMGGLPASILVHGAHNLGVAFGIAAGSLQLGRNS